jgi:hypothetical protein
MADGAIRLKVVSASLVNTPPAGRVWVFFDEDNADHLSIKDETGTVTDLQNALNYTDEKAQDAVGSILTDSADVDFTYDDVANQITAVLTTTSVVAGAFGSASSTLLATVDSKGRLTALSQTPIAITPSQAGIGTNQIVDHSTVAVQTNVNSGLAGGGDLTANRSLSLDINNLQSQTPFVGVPQTALVSYYDTTLMAHRKATKSQLLGRNPEFYHNEFSDFIVTTLGGLTSLVTGTGASSQAGTYGQDNAENCKGVVQYDTGTTATGRAGLGTSTANPMFLQTSDFYRLQFRAAIESLSTTSVEAFSWYPCAFTSATNATGFGNNFAGFFYREDQNGGRFQFVVYSNGVLEAALDTGFLADIDYQIFEVTLDGATGTAMGYINNNLVATVSSGLFAGPTQTFGFVTKIEKRVGTTQRNADIDWYNFEYFRSTLR